MEENEEIEGDKENIKMIEEGKIIVEDTNENDKYLEKIEKSEIKHLDEMKSCLLKINPNDIKKEGEDS